MPSSRTDCQSRFPTIRSWIGLFLVAVAMASACASTSAGSKPVPAHAIEVAADTKVADAGDAAAPQGADAPPAQSPN